MMNWIYTCMMAVSILLSWISGSGQALSAAVPAGAAQGVSLSLSLAGPLLFWSGLGKLMDASGFTSALTLCIKPVISRLFPEARKDPVLAGHLSANLCANFLGLGNAATPRGIQAALRLKNGSTDSLCRLVVLNTASIQLIPTGVAAIRAGLGCRTPFDILPAVWITSLCSAGMGLLAAWILGKLWHHD